MSKIFSFDLNETLAEAQEFLAENKKWEQNSNHNYTHIAMWGYRGGHASMAKTYFLDLRDHFGKFA